MIQQCYSFDSPFTTSVCYYHQACIAYSVILLLFSNIVSNLVLATRDFETPRDLSASSLSDYTAITGVMVDFNAGQSTGTVTIDITPDDLLESDEQFQVYLYDPDTAEALGDLHKAIVTIYDDDCKLGLLLTVLFMRFGRYSCNT